MRQPVELHHVETFSGAACCQPIELQYYKAAPLQDGGYPYIHPATHSRTTTKDEGNSAGCGPALGTAHPRFRIRVSSRSAQRTSSCEARRRWYFLWSTS